MSLCELFHKLKNKMFQYTVSSTDDQLCYQFTDNDDNLRCSRKLYDQLGNSTSGQVMCFDLRQQLSTLSLENNLF